MSVKIDRKAFDQLMKQAPQEVDSAWKAAGQKYRDLTPIKSGNARRNTRVQGNEIQANYAYADRLDRGWSDQAPRGMSTETLDYFNQQIQKSVDKLNG